MPFKSEKQRRYMHANLPEIAKRWERDYASGGIARVGFANGLMPDPFYNQGEFQTFQQPKNFNLNNYPYSGPVQSGYVNTGNILGYGDNLSFEKDFRGNKLSNTGAQMRYQTPRTIVDQVYAASDPYGNIQMDLEKENFYESPQGLAFLKNKMGNMFSNAGNMLSNAKDFTGNILTQGKDSSQNFLKKILDNTLFGRIAGGFDATNPKAFNYNPALQGQIDWMKGLGNYGIMDQSGLNKITGGVLKGKALQSMFGSNDLGAMYDKSIAQTEKIISNLDNQWGNLLDPNHPDYNPQKFNQKMAFHKNLRNKKIQEKKLHEKAAADDLAKRKAASKQKWQRDYSTWTSSSGRDHKSTAGIGSKVSKKGHSGSSHVGGSLHGGGHSGSGYQGKSGSHHYRRGGIASLWQK